MDLSANSAINRWAITDCLDALRHEPFAAERQDIAFPRRARERGRLKRCQEPFLTPSSRGQKNN